MARLSTLGTSVKWGVLRKGPRVFALLGKATPSGITSFSPYDVPNGWALTAEFGCLRLERLTGDEEVTGQQLVLPTPFSYEYGVTGQDETGEIARGIFGLLPSELERLVNVLRKGSYPILGFSQTDLRCCITSSIIPAYWPHLVVSNLTLYGDAVSMEAFVRIMIASMSQGRLLVRFPGMQQLVKQMLWVMILQRRGIHYTKEALELAPRSALAAK
ncbi:MAG TPA: hypothetical protein VFD66_06760 [Verrucomicrobiae bacterium]|nr:hypothetical protein [Verrucomicrobiae bacterium]